MKRVAISLIFLLGISAAGAQPASLGEWADLADEYLRAETEVPLETLVSIDPPLISEGPLPEFDDSEPFGDIPDAELAGFDTPTDLLPAPAHGGTEGASPGRSGITIGGGPVPQGWVEKSFNDHRFAVPQGWITMEDNEDTLVLFGGDPATQTGPLLGMFFDSEPASIAEVAEIEDLGEIELADGRKFRHLRYLQPMGGEEKAEGEMFYSIEPEKGREHLIISAAVFKGTFEDHRETLLAALASIRLAARIPVEPDRFLDGALSMRLPAGWHRMSGERSHIDQIFGDLSRGGLVVARGEQLTGHQIYSAMPVRFHEEQAELSGLPVRRYEWSSEEDGTRVRHQLFVFETCLPGDEPVGVWVRGSPPLHDSSEVVSMLDGLRIDLPQAALPCTVQAFPGGAARTRTGEQETDATPPPAETTIPETPEVVADNPPFTAAEPEFVEQQPSITERVVRFDARSTGGWTGYYATLTAPAAGGPSGGAFLHVFTPGDGTTGYIIAPPGLLGDWRGFGSVSVTMMTGNGPWLDAYTYGGVGDIAITSGSMRASTTFPSRAATVWTRQEIALVDGPDWRFSGGARSLADILANVTDFRIRAEFLSGDATAGFAEIAWVSGETAPVRQEVAPVPPQPPILPPQPPEPVVDVEPDTFEPDAGSYTIYRNARFGTTISYPGTYFEPDPPPANGDGRTFRSADGSATFYVFAQFDAFMRRQEEMMADDKLQGGYDRVTYERAGHNWYVLSGFREGDIFYRKVLTGEPGDLFRAFEISYPASQKAAFDAVVTYMAQSFGPPVEAGTGAPWQQEQPVQQHSGGVAGIWAIHAGGYTGRLTIALGPDGLSGYVHFDALRRDEILEDVRFDPAAGRLEFYRPTARQRFEARLRGDRLAGSYRNGGPAGEWSAALIERDDFDPDHAEWDQPVVEHQRLGRLYTPERGDPVRTALMDAARPPIQLEIGRPVIFVVQVLRTDGNWAYLQAQPRNPDGTEIRWSTTRFAREYRIGAMSDIAMVLMRREAGRWQVVDHVLGPTDVHWYGWLDAYGLPEELFTR